MIKTNYVHDLQQPIRCFISAKHSYATTKFVYDNRSIITVTRYFYYRIWSSLIICRKQLSHVTEIAFYSYLLLPLQQQLIFSIHYLCTNATHPFDVCPLSLEYMSARGKLSHLSMANAHVVVVVVCVKALQIPCTSIHDKIFWAKNRSECVVNCGTFDNFTLS